MILGGIIIVICIAGLHFGTKEEWRDFLWFIIACIYQKWMETISLPNIKYD